MYASPSLQDLTPTQPPPFPAGYNPSRRRSPKQRPTASIKILVRLEPLDKPCCRLSSSFSSSSSSSSFLVGTHRPPVPSQSRQTEMHPHNPAPHPTPQPGSICMQELVRTCGGMLEDGDPLSKADIHNSHTSWGSGCALALAFAHAQRRCVVSWCGNHASNHASIHPCIRPWINDPPYPRSPSTKFLELQSSALEQTPASECILGRLQ